MSDRIQLTYVLPLKWSGDIGRREMTEYITRLVDVVEEVIVVDGSDARAFEAHAALWGERINHMPPDPHISFANGKALGATTGIGAAACDKVVVADDDVRYERGSLTQLGHMLDHADLVRPQNYFTCPMPWHAHWDTARTILNRAAGADYPGTLALRKSFFTAMGGYDGNVLFENFELIRTVERNGGRVNSPLDLFVARLPPTRARFLSQRVRQAYDDFALPNRMAVWLAVLPVTLWVLSNGRVKTGTGLIGGTMVFAELGRRRAFGRTVFPARASLLAPAWILERGFCAWLALFCRMTGGIRYGGVKIKNAANRTGPGEERSHSAYAPPTRPGL